MSSIEYSPRDYPSQRPLHLVGVASRIVRALNFGPMLTWQVGWSHPDSAHSASFSDPQQFESVPGVAGLTRRTTVVPGSPGSGRSVVVVRDLEAPLLQAYGSFLGGGPSGLLLALPSSSYRRPPVLASYG